MRHSALHRSADYGRKPPNSAVDICGWAIRLPNARGLPTIHPAAVPRVHLLALTPDHFPVSEELGKAGVCVEERMRRFLAGEERPAGEGCAVVPVAEKKHPKL
ncbi:putative glycerate kinase [Trypanosoma conorhini]|uniref:Putative glycerate kinase n=1 Tax=Trypanosoma conorhini TaxID=83891 RepID=A0A422MT13_9TRYP|nr:putative glycerate kinase [Trypanosoma conorhini]RNE96385.1 putative glycerate kinase [Trypanosoma conorhini]